MILPKNIKTASVLFFHPSQNFETPTRLCGPARLVNIISQCAFHEHRITGFSCSTFLNIHTIPFCFYFSENGLMMRAQIKQVWCVCPLRSHHHHVHPPPGWSWSTERPHHLPGERRIKMLRIPLLPKREAGSGLQTHSHQEGIHPHRQPVTVFG